MNSKRFGALLEPVQDHLRIIERTTHRRDKHFHSEWHPIALKLSRNERRIQDPQYRDKTERKLRARDSRNRVNANPVRHSPRAASASCHTSNDYIDDRLEDVVQFLQNSGRSDHHRGLCDQRPSINDVPVSAVERCTCQQLWVHKRDRIWTRNVNAT